MVLHKPIHILWRLLGILLLLLLSIIKSYVVIYHLLNIYVVLIVVAIVLRLVAVLVWQLSYLIAHIRLSLTQLALLGPWHIVFGEFDCLVTRAHFFRTWLNRRSGLGLNSVHLFQVISILPRYFLFTFGLFPLLATDVGSKTSHFLVFESTLLVLIIFEVVLLRLNLFAASN